MNPPGGAGGRRMSQGSAAGGDPCPADAKLLCWLLSPAHTAPSSPSAASGSLSSPQRSFPGTERLTPCPAGAETGLSPKLPPPVTPWGSILEQVQLGRVEWGAVRPPRGHRALWVSGHSSGVGARGARGSRDTAAGRGCSQRLAGLWHCFQLPSSSLQQQRSQGWPTVPGRCQGGRVKGQGQRLGWAGLATVPAVT